jgi:spore coat protein U-like protein
MYPATYGTLSTIYDSNGYLIYQDGTQSNLWTHSVATVSSKESGWWNSTNYRVYRTLDERTIPVPSEYKFNFS